MKWINPFKLKSASLVLTTALLLTLKSWAGGWFGNGGLSVLDSDNPWFLGEESISYCVFSDSNTAPGLAAIEQMIKINSAKWSDFFEKYRNNVYGTGFNKFSDKSYKKISTHFEKSNSCQDVIQNCVGKNFDENKCAQSVSDKVLFLFGNPNPIIKKYLDTNGQAQGLALRTEYDHISYRSGGIVWISEQQRSGWSSYQHLLLHEMGHIMGMVHDSCWVMSQDVAFLIKSWNGIGDLGQIESRNWPYSFLNGDVLLFTDQKFSFGDFPKGYYSNRIFQPDFLMTLNFDKDAAFKLTANIIEVVNNNVKLELVFEEFPSEKKVIWSGELSSKTFWQTNPIQPHLYTEWVVKYEQGAPFLNTNSYVYSTPIEKKQFSTEYLTQGWAPTELMGSVKYKNTVMPVVLTRQKGLSLSFFDVQGSVWMNFVTVQRKIYTSNLFTSRNTGF